MEKLRNVCVRDNVIMEQNNDRGMREQQERNREQREKQRGKVEREM
jgi:hypothetical protein